MPVFLIFFIVGSLLTFCHLQAGAEAEAEPASLSLESWIKAAGNEDSDEKRLEILKDLLDWEELEPEHRGHALRLIGEIEDWLYSGDLPGFRPQIQNTGTYDFGIPEGSPFFPLTQIYEARMLTWTVLGYGSWWSLPENRLAKLARTRHMIEGLISRFPQNRLLRMYLGEPYPPKKTYVPAPGAPAWAVYQREGVERLADIVEWWIDNRLRENGEYGGGWGDDCEMWRVWMPVLIAFEDPKIVAAQEFFSRALLSQPHMAGGYTSIMSDVEHTAEDSADTITPMMMLKAEDPHWIRYAELFATYMRDLWTGRNERGLLQFRSTYFTSSEIDLTPRKACAAVYEARAVQPVLLYWLRTANADLTDLFTAWLDGWVDAALREERGKPAGIIPSAVHWPDGTIGGLGENWWKPGNYTDDPLYVWPSAMSMMTQSLVQGWHLTGNEKYLEPIKAMARIRQEYLDNPAPHPEPGTAAWCGQRMGGLIPALAKIRMLSGTTEFDRLLETDSNAYTRYRFFKDKSGMETALRNTAEAFRSYGPGYTSEVRCTDRLIRFPQLFTNAAMFEKPLAGVHVPNSQLLFSTLTGEPGSGSYFPLNAVRWLTPPRDFAALVQDSGADRLQAELFHFGTEPREFEAELYLLEKGNYGVELIDLETGHPIMETTLASTGKTSRIALRIPPRQRCRLLIHKIERKSSGAAAHLSNHRGMTLR